ncbi:CGNR zinc finger domain-containing protein [Nonomuraea roseoviolacea subsp. roseoviolacea]
MAHLAGGGAPLLGEPPAIELGNTTYAVRGRPQDGLRSVEHLAAWLRDMRPRLAVGLADADIEGVTEADLRLARELRDTIRSLAAATVDGGALDPDLVATLNRHAGHAPRWRELRTTPEPHTTERTAGRPVAAALAEVAENAVDLLGGPLRDRLRACQRTGCLLYFIRDASRREWCSAGCGNRARAARHYAKVRRGSGG